MSRQAQAQRVAVLARAAADLPETAQNGQLLALRAEMEALLRCLPGVAGPRPDPVRYPARAEALAGEDPEEARFDNMPV